MGLCILPLGKNSIPCKPQAEGSIQAKRPSNLGEPRKLPIACTFLPLCKSATDAIHLITTTPTFYPCLCPSQRLHHGSYCVATSQLAKSLHISRGSHVAAAKASARCFPAIGSNASECDNLC